MFKEEKENIPIAMHARELDADSKQPQRPQLLTTSLSLIKWSQTLGMVIILILGHSWHQGRVSMYLPGHFNNGERVIT